MQRFYVLNIKHFRRWAVVVIFALFTSLFIWFEHDGFLSVFSQDDPSALARGNANETNIALTFNISWGDEKVHGILEQLEQEDIQATFFVSGEWAERHPEIVEDITEANHELGMLGYRYKSYLDQDIEEVKKDLLKAKEVFRKLEYDDINLLRAPSGHFNKDIIEMAERLELKSIHWNVHPHDWKNPGTDIIVDHVMKETENGDIILLHASDSVKQTEKALSVILPGLKNKGFTFVSISELINQANSEAKLIE